MKKPQVIAFYLPQFYPTPENDEWWEPGFTEWTNVARAKPLFKGHYQPRIPRDLGFYDLRVPETREKQAILAREAGVDGFCYWHYWFGNGKRLLADVFKEVVETGKPDFPFCLCWANHSWYQKTWDPNMPNKLLMEQTYPGVEDYTAHFMEMLPAFKDKRYMRTENGRLIFGVFAPHDFLDFPRFRDTWNKLAKENGLEGFMFFAFIQGVRNLSQLPSCYDIPVVYDALFDSVKAESTVKQSLFKKVQTSLKNKMGWPVRLTSYVHYTETALKRFREEPTFIPCIDPNFDHSPRSAHKGVILHDCSAEAWGHLCSETKKMVMERDIVDKIIFIKAWNEWGEGNYLEPDSRYGKSYIEESGKVFNINSKN